MKMRILKRVTGATSLYRMIYCSRNVIAEVVPGASTAYGMEREIQAILESARRCNIADHVTGALLCTPSGFAQVLEGPREVLERTFERIDGDRRHADVMALSFTPTGRRSFPDWPMGFHRQTSAEEADPLAHLLADSGFAGRRVTTGRDVLRLLESVVRPADDWIVT
jgi:hypothetical protein